MENKPSKIPTPSKRTSITSRSSLGHAAASPQPSSQPSSQPSVARSSAQHSIRRKSFIPRPSVGSSSPASTVRVVTPPTKTTTSPPSTASARDKPLPDVPLPLPPATTRHGKDAQRPESNSQSSLSLRDRLESSRAKTTPPTSTAKEFRGHEKRDSKMSAVIRDPSPASDRTAYDSDTNEIPRAASESPSSNYPRVRRPDSIRYPPMSDAWIPPSNTFPSRAPPSTSPFTAPLSTIDSQPLLVSGQPNEDDETPRNSMQEAAPDFNDLHDTVQHSDAHPFSTETQQQWTNTLRNLEGHHSAQPTTTPDSIGFPSFYNKLPEHMTERPPAKTRDSAQNYMRLTSSASSKRAAAIPTSPPPAPQPAPKQQRGRMGFPKASDNKAAPAPTGAPKPRRSPSRSRAALNKIGGLFANKRGKRPSISEPAPAPSVPRGKVPRVPKSPGGTPMISAPSNFRKTDGATPVAIAPEERKEPDLHTTALALKDEAERAHYRANNAKGEAKEARRKAESARLLAVKAMEASQSAGRDAADAHAAAVDSEKESAEAFKAAERALAAARAVQAAVMAVTGRSGS